MGKTPCLSIYVLQVFFYNLKQLETMFIIPIENIFKIITSKCMHNFPPHLSCVATLPENTLASELERHSRQLYSS